MTVDRRREPRVEANLPVLLWGIDAQGLPFAQTALARNISRQGALLTGLTQALRYGDPVVIQYGKNRARFRVVWTRNIENGDKIRAAVQKLESDQCPWKDELQPKARASSEVADDSIMHLKPEG